MPEIINMRDAVSDGLERWSGGVIPYLLHWPRICHVAESDKSKVTRRSTRLGGVIPYLLLLCCLKLRNDDNILVEFSFGS